MSPGDGGRIARPRGLDEQLAIEQDRIGPWRASIDPAWSGFGGAHGGLLAALALRALQTGLGQSAPPPRSLSLRFLEPTRPLEVELKVDLDRGGRSSAAASVSLRQSGTLTCSGHGLFGAERESPAHLGVEMPSVPPPEECRPSGDKPPAEAGVGQLVEYRPDAGPPALFGKLSRFVLFAGGGYAIEDGEMWTPSGRLVLLSRQVRRILPGLP